MKDELVIYNTLLADIKNRVRQGQLRANMSANAEMLATYWDIGKMIHERQKLEGWGKGVIPRLAQDLKNELAEVKGFSERNILRMLTFYKEYSHFPISPPAVAKLENEKDLIGKQTLSQLENETGSFSPTLLAKLEENAKMKPAVSQLTEIKNSITQLPVAQLQNIDIQYDLILSTGWANHTILIQKVKDLPNRYWYMQQAIANGWSFITLENMIKSKLHERQGNAVTNFEFTLPPLQSALAKQMLKDPYLFDFATLATEFTERELELELVKHVEKFLIELGAGFAFVGRQYKLEISHKDVYLDLLFYHLKMRCFVVIELKRGDFIPEYAGKMNFYCSAVDDILKHPADQATIGLILCQGKDKLFAEYSLKDINKPIGISEYELTRILPENLKNSLPSIEEIEQELSLLVNREKEDEV